jgi:hypothetical protein
MVLTEAILVYYENRMKHTKTLCGKSAGFQHAKAGRIVEITGF